MSALNVTLSNGGTERVASKLQAYTRLSDADVSALDKLRRDVRRVQARRDLVREGDKPRFVHLMLSGWACRYKTLPDGKRQIVGLFIPGDFCDLNVYILKHMDHNIGAITDIEVAAISPDEMERLTAAHPRITQALLWHELVTVAIQREWMLNLGQRSAYERIAHLFVELFLRLRTVGMTHGSDIDFPLTQSDLADATGLTAVHVNRTLQQLRSDGLIELERRHLRIPDLERLMNAAMFNPNYLHLDQEGAHLNANN